MEELLIAEALKRADGNQTIAAQLLGISRKALNNRPQRGGTFRIFVPFCGTLLQPLSGKGLSALFPEFCRIPRPNVPPLSILQYRAFSPPSKKICIAEPAPRLDSTPPPA